MEEKPTKPKRTVFGKIIKWTFIIFNIIMLIWLIAGVGGAANEVSKASSEAEEIGGAIGAGIGAAIIIFLWVAGDVILGLFVLFTRPKR